MTKLLNQCGWLSIKQLVEYHSLLLVYKIKSDSKPEYLHQKLCREFSYKTRLAAGGGIRGREIVRHELMSQSFVPRATLSWNNLPVNIRMANNVNAFKLSVKQWIRDNISIA